MSTTDIYVLGHTDAELRRLTTQARVIDPITRRFLTAAGIKEGMRVLDVGSGAGDVAILLADLVGATGEVVGTDTARVAIDAAEARIRTASLTTVTFRHGDPAELTFDDPFDAVVGRYVLQFIPDPSATVAQLAKHLRPGGLMFFHELDWDGARSSPRAPTYDQVCDWIGRMVEAGGAQAHLGPRLPAIFANAGLLSPSMRLESFVGTGATAMDAALLVTDLVTAHLPKMERMGIVTASDVALPTLTQRILAEVGPDGILVGRAEVAAWAQV